MNEPLHTKEDLKLERFFVIPVQVTCFRGFYLDY